MFIYTRHAERRIEQRRLFKAQIEEAVLQPDKVLPGFKKRKLAQRDFSGNILEVVYRREGNTTVILTAYWLEED